MQSASQRTLLDLPDSRRGKGQDAEATLGTMVRLTGSESASDGYPSDLGWLLISAYTPPCSWEAAAITSGCLIGYFKARERI